MIKSSVVESVIFNLIHIWQHFGNRKSVSQNKLCNRSKKSAFL